MIQMKKAKKEMIKGTKLKIKLKAVKKVGDDEEEGDDSWWCSHLEITGNTAASESFIFHLLCSAEIVCFNNFN